MAQFDANVERQKVGQKAIRSDIVVEDLGREAGPVEKAEDQCCSLCIRLPTEPALIGSEGFERLLDH